jgi:hypothetical protein
MALGRNTAAATPEMLPMSESPRREQRQGGVLGKPGLCGGLEEASTDSPKDEVQSLETRLDNSRAVDNLQRTGPRAYQ